MLLAQSLGNVGIGTTNPQAKFEVRSSGSDTAYIRVQSPSNGAGINIQGQNQTTNLGYLSQLENFQIQNGGSGGMSIDVGGTAWGAYSDERKKDIVKPITDGLSKVNSLRTVMGNYKDSPDISHPFLIAQDVEKVLPEAVYADSDGYLSLRYTDVIPLLTAAIKELKAQNDALELRLKALEGK